VTLVHPEPEFHVVFSNGLREAREFRCAGCHETVGAALQALSCRPSEFILIDDAVRDADFPQLTKHLVALVPHCGLVFLIAPGEKPEILTVLLRAGASAVVEKPCGINDCLAALRTVQKGDVYLSQKAINALAKSLCDTTTPGNLPPLSPAEGRVATLLRDGLSDKEIAGKLGIAPGTVHRHTSSIYRKLHVHSRTALARKCFSPFQLPFLQGF
jgi:DNA-binding NarL/FixJ family response regulator